MKPRYLLSRIPCKRAPGSGSLNQPGQTVAWPFPLLPAFYVTFMPLIAMVGSAVIRAARRRFPTLSAPALLVACFGAMLVLEIVFEGVVFLPLGFWTYASGRWPLTFGGHYFQLPVNELLHAATIYTFISALRYFRNDRGLSAVESGAEHLTGARRAAVFRALAVIGVIHVGQFAFYHRPEMVGGANSARWPTDVTSRSYFNNQCGPTLDRACPGPGVPLSRPDSGYLNWEGHFVGQPLERSR